MITTNVNAGAGRAAIRHHLALIEAGYQSHLWYLDGDITVINTLKIKSPLLKILNQLKYRTRKIITRLFGSNEPGFKSLSIFPSGLVGRINSHDCDIVQLNWICDFLSIKDIGRIEKPVVWRFSDMWPLLGTQHYTENFHMFYRKGYSGEQSWQSSESDGLPTRLDRWIWSQKKKHWRQSIIICSPSAWLANLARQSRLSDQWTIFTTGTTIDTNVFRPISPHDAKSRLRISLEKRLVLIGSRNNRDERKGIQIFLEALSSFNHTDNLQVACFGLGVHDSTAGYNIINFGPIESEQEMALLLSAADVVVIPSRLDNLPQVALEALSCGCPIVGFNVSGLADLIRPGINGELAKPFCAKSLGQKILQVLNAKNTTELRSQCRAYALDNYSKEAVIKKYFAAYQAALKTNYLKASTYID
jgi:glycosyltransferase involved in cell wall biosynthesis